MKKKILEEINKVLSSLEESEIGVHNRLLRDDRDNDH
jgi:hypothetical protein